MNRTKQARQKEIGEHLDKQLEHVIGFIEVVKREEPFKSSADTKAEFLTGVAEYDQQHPDAKRKGHGFADDGAFNAFWDIAWAKTMERN